MSDVALRFGARDDGLDAQFKKMGAQLDALQARVSKTGSAISASFRNIGAAAAAVAFGKLIGDALEFADQLEAANVRTGISIEGLQRLQFIATQTSGNLDTLTAAVGKMQLQLSKAGDGVEDAQKALLKLQIPLSEFSGLKPDEQFERVAVAIAKIQDPTARAAAAQGLFGKSYQENLPVLISTGTELEKLSVQFDAIGGPVSKEAIDKVDDLGDSFGTLKIAATNLTAELVSGVAPALTDVTGLATKFIAGLRAAAGGGDNEVVKIGRQIERIKASIEGIKETSLKSALGFGFTDEETAAIARLTAQIKQLEAEERKLLGLGLEGAAAEKARIAAIDAQLTPVAISVKRKPTPFEDTPQGRRESFIVADDPEIIAAIDVKDEILKINQEKIDALMEQENAASINRLDLAKDTQVTLLSLTEAFTGQIIDFAQFRADFEQSATLATVSLVGQALAASFQKNKAASIALAVISTIAGVARALKDYPYPYSLAVGGAVALSGAAQIAKIRSTNYNASGQFSGGSIGGVSGSLPGGGSLSSPVSAPPAPQERGVAQIIINGPITGEQSMRWLVENLRQYVGDFDLVLQPAGR